MFFFASKEVHIFCHSLHVKQFTQFFLICSLFRIPAYQLHPSSTVTPIFSCPTMSFPEAGLYSLDRYDIFRLFCSSQNS